MVVVLGHVAGGMWGVQGGKLYPLFGPLVHGLLLVAVIDGMGGSEARGQEGGGFAVAADPLSCMLGHAFNDVCVVESCGQVAVSNGVDRVVDREDPYRPPGEFGVRELLLVEAEEDEGGAGFPKVRRGDAQAIFTEGP